MNARVSLHLLLALEVRSTACADEVIIHATSRVCLGSCVDEVIIHATARVCIALRYILDGCMINGVSVLCVRLLANPRILRFCYTAIEKIVIPESAYHERSTSAKW